MIVKVTYHVKCNCNLAPCISWHHVNVPYLVLIVRVPLDRLVTKSTPNMTHYTGPYSLQINYLTDESFNIGKGANTIISMLHHFFWIPCLWWDQGASPRRQLHWPELKTTSWSIVSCGGWWPGSTKRYNCCCWLAIQSLHQIGALVFLNNCLKKQEWDHQ